MVYSDSGGDNDHDMARLLQMMQQQQIPKTITPPEAGETVTPINM